MTTRKKPKAYTVGPNATMSQDAGKEPEYPDGGEWGPGESYVPPASMTAERIATLVQRGVLIDPDAENADG